MKSNHKKNLEIHISLLWQLFIKISAYMMFIYILRSTSQRTKVWCKIEVLMTKKQALPYSEAVIIEIMTLVKPCSRPGCWSGTCHLIYLPPQITTWLLLTKRQETSVGFLTEHHQQLLWVWGLSSYGCWFLREGQDLWYRFTSRV